MWLLRPKRVLERECYLWSMAVHIAATVFSVGTMTYRQVPYDLESLHHSTIGRLNFHRQHPRLTHCNTSHSHTSPDCNTMQRTVTLPPHVCWRGERLL